MTSSFERAADDAVSRTRFVAEPHGREARRFRGDAESAPPGAPVEDVEAQLYRLYGDVILSAPRAEGWGLAAYLVPVGAFLLGGAVLAVFLRRQGGSSSAAAPDAAAAADPELERIVDEELRNAAR